MIQVWDETATLVCKSLISWPWTTQCVASQLWEMILLLYFPGSQDSHCAAQRMSCIKLKVKFCDACSAIQSPESLHAQYDEGLKGTLKVQSRNCMVEFSFSWEQNTLTLMCIHSNCQSKRLGFQQSKALICQPVRYICKRWCEVWRLASITAMRSITWSLISCHASWKPWWTIGEVPSQYEPRLGSWYALQACRSSLLVLQAFWLGRVP